MTFDGIVIGGGPAGMFAAITAANRGQRVLLLERNDLLAVIKLEVSAVVERLKSKNITLKITNEVLDFLLDKGFEPEYGARPLRRAVERYLEDPLADELLKGALQKSSKITVAIDGDTLRFQTQEAKAPARRRKKSSE